MTTIYVSNDGSDSTGTGTATNPYRTLNVAQNYAFDGYTIWVLPKKQGSTGFNEPLVISDTFYITKKITLRGTTYSTSSIQFTTLSTYAAIYIQNDDITIKNLTIYTTSSAAIMNDIASDGTIAPTLHSNLLIDTCKFTYSTYALYMYTNVLMVRNCIFEPLNSSSFNSAITLGRIAIYTEISGCSNLTNVPYHLLELGIYHTAGNTYDYECFQYTGQLIVRDNTFNSSRNAVLIGWYSTLFTPVSTNLLYMNICGNTFTASSFAHLDIPSMTSNLLAMFGLLAFYKNSSTNSNFSGCLYIAGDYGGIIPVECKTIFDSNDIPDDSGSIYNYNAQPYITADSLNKTVVFSNTTNYIQTTFDTAYPYIEDPKQFENILAYLVNGTYYRNIYSPIVLCQNGVITVTMNSITMTVTNPVLLDSYFIGIDTSVSTVHDSPIAFKFFINEYDDSDTLLTTVSQNLSFTFTTAIPEKIYEFYLFSYNEFLSDYVNSWIIMTKSSNTVYTTALTIDGSYAVAEIGGLGSDFGSTNISGQSIIGTDISIRDTISAGNITINNADGLTDLYQTKINDSTAINMDINTNYSLAVSGTAFLSTGTTWTTASDKRIKKNIKKIDSNKIIDLVSKMDVYEYEYDKRYHDDKGKKRLGLIAQDIEEIEPKEYVSMVKNFGDLKLGKDAIDGFKTVDYSNLLFYLLVATQKLLK